MNEWMNSLKDYESPEPDCVLLIFQPPGNGQPRAKFEVTWFMMQISGMRHKATNLYWVFTQWQVSAGCLRDEALSPPHNLRSSCI